MASSIKSTSNKPGKATGGAAKPQTTENPQNGKANINGFSSGSSYATYNTDGSVSYTGTANGSTGAPGAAGATNYTPQTVDPSTMPSSNSAAIAQQLAAMQASANSSGYRPRTEEEMRQQANAEKQSYYDQLRLSSQQQYDTTDLALRQQREGLQATYDKQREASAKQYAQNYSQADRHALSRGMQRSSYNGQTLANINQQASEAQQNIWDAQAAAEGNIDQQRAQLASQLAAQMHQYNASQANDAQNRYNELEQQNYDRMQADQNRKDNLNWQLYQAMYQGGRDEISDWQWAQGFNAQQAQNAISNQQWQQQFNAQQQQNAMQNWQWQQNFDFQQQQWEYDHPDKDDKKNNSSSSSGNKTNNSNNQNPASTTGTQPNSWQNFLNGITANLVNNHPMSPNNTPPVNR